MYGPYSPSLAAPSHADVPSCHAEVHAIKHVLSLNNNNKKRRGCLENAKIFITRWSRGGNGHDWRLQDGVPCVRCLDYIKKHNIAKVYVSSRRGGVVRKSWEELDALSRPSTGLLYGR